MYSTKNIIFTLYLLASVCFVVQVVPAPTKEKDNQSPQLKYIKVKQDVWEPRRSSAEIAHDSPTSSTGSPNSILGSPVLLSPTTPSKSRLQKSSSSIGTDTTDLQPESPQLLKFKSSIHLTRSASDKMERAGILDRNSSLKRNSENTLLSSSTRSRSSSPRLHVIQKGSITFKKSENSLFKTVALQNIDRENKNDKSKSASSSKYRKTRSFSINSSPEGSSRSLSRSNSSTSGSSRSGRSSGSSNSSRSGRPKKERRVYLERPFDDLLNQRQSSKSRVCRKPGCNHRDAKTCNRKAAGSRC